MGKYKNKNKLKSKGLLSHLFAFYSSVFSIFDDIEPFKTFKEKKTFKSMILAFNGKSAKEIKQQLKLEEFKEEEKLRMQARKELGL
jgi:hypothetical protein